MRKGQFIFLLVLVTISIFCTTQTVQSLEPDKALVEREQYFNTLEEKYVSSMRKLLAESGYANSGITMTSIIEENGAREYRVLLHHDRFERMSELEKTELVSRLEEVSFAEEKCTFYHEFL
ncbi:MAG: hypothetical protein IJ485_07015 [Lachnospiraceae bacterium]|nr:hypothetical protein [Lachnospiraceae bacterium]